MTYYLLYKKTSWLSSSSLMHSHIADFLYKDLLYLKQLLREKNDCTKILYYSLFSTDQQVFQHNYQIMKKLYQYIAPSYIIRQKEQARLIILMKIYSLYIFRNCCLDALKTMESPLEDGSVRADEHKVRNTLHAIDVCRHIAAVCEDCPVHLELCRSLESM